MSHSCYENHKKDVFLVVLFVFNQAWSLRVNNEHILVCFY